MNITTYTNTLQQKGYLAYEYNPFHNYQTNVNLLLIDGFYIPEGKAVNKKNGLLLTKIGDDWYDELNCKITDNNIIIEYDSTKQADITAGSLIDLDTKLLQFDLSHPVDIEVQPSYDGSVNLILNDDKNIPRLINSRFSVREKNTYEIVDRIGENDTNIYSSDTFEKDTSLYFLYKTNPKIEYRGFITGELPVGLYCFYFTYCDSDGNESDFIAESGLIPVFMGMDGDMYSMDGGIKNLSSNKGIRLKLTNLDSSYNYLKVYYVRYFADYALNRIYECKKLDYKYPIISNKLILQITGFEEGEDLDPSILNMIKFNPKSILTQAQCKNMLFFGNIVKNYDNYIELQDCALRIVPTPNSLDSNEINYYNSSNIYNKVGYFNNEYYRFGVVFIYENGTLSNVYNTLGWDFNLNVSLTSLSNNNSVNDLYEDLSPNSAFLTRKYIKVDDEGWIINGDNIFTTTSRLNAKGVCKFPKNHNLYSVKFNIPNNVKEYLHELGIRGLFFVRLKRIPNLIAQCYILPMDEILEAPIVYTGNKTFTECFITKRSYGKRIKAGWISPKSFDEGGLLDNSDYKGRLYEYTKLTAISKSAFAGICPDFLLNQPYYNQIFNGSHFKLQQVTRNSSLTNPNSQRIYEQTNSVNENVGSTVSVTISSVTDDVSTVALDNLVFRLEIGKAEEAYRFKYAQYDNGTYKAGSIDKTKVNKASNIVRGKYSPYLAIKGAALLPGEIYNIYLDTFLDNDQQFLNRMNSSEPFYAISDRYNWDEFQGELECFRGDCYSNTFTYRLNRNFNDSTLPNNDHILDKNSWRDNYDAFNSSKWKDISRSDVNAVQLGSWILFKVKSPYNYALRSEDCSYTAENALMGAPRSFYPRRQMMWLGNYKMPDSYLYNDAYRATLGYKCYFTLNDPNYIKNTFSNRILYSSIAIQDSFKNNYRESYSTYFRDYSSEYGGITKLVGFEGHLLVIFEHAIGIAIINERVLMSEGSEGNPVFINTLNVLPEELTIITDTYGTLWSESVVKSESGYVYGVDTVAKKIWRVQGQQIEILSDFKVNKFLINNISLGERELYPIIGLRNVKTHYNNNKKDIMFTFYDDVYLDEEKVWNLCYNELLGLFITFYSWIPSYSENIDTQFFTFNRETSKWLTLLLKNNYNILENTGIVVDSPILEIENGSLTEATLYYRTKNPVTKAKISVIGLDGTLYTQQNDIAIPEDYPINGVLPILQLNTLNVKFNLEKDHWGFWKYIDENELERNKIVFTEGGINLFTKVHPVVTLLITPTIDTIDSSGNTVTTKFETETVAFTLKSIVENPSLTVVERQAPSLTTDFYLHGQAGIFDVKETLYPTHWYGEFHPFEFEFVVNDKIGQQKVFSNLVIISNKAEPESFHFEIEGDNYDFSSDKRTMYFRQEATKELFLKLGSNMLFDRKYVDIVADKYTQEQYYRGNPVRRNSQSLEDSNEYINLYSKFDRVYPIQSEGLVLQEKSTIFPLYYERVDTYNDIYYKYREMLDGVETSYDFKNLSGSEIKWYRDLNLFNVITHIKNSPIDLVGRIRGNSRYKEGKWTILIPSIVFNLKNETDWKTAQEYNKFFLDKSQTDAYCALIVLNYKHGDTLALPPVIINSSNIPNDLMTGLVSEDKLPNIYLAAGYNPVRVDGWTYRKEARIRDKWMKVRVRYSGKNLAVIHSLITLYNISYS